MDNPMDRGAWWATVHGGRKELDSTKRLNTHNTHRYFYSIFIFGLYSLVL